MTEFATQTRTSGTYPDDWGIPEGRALSNQRIIWVLRNLGAANARSNRRRSPTDALARVAAERAARLR